MTLAITEITIHPATDASGPWVAFVRIVLNGEFVVNSIKIVKGKFGLFVAFPREYNKKEGKGYNLCFPITKTLQERMSGQILAAYHRQEEGLPPAPLSTPKEEKELGRNRKTKSPADPLSPYAETLAEAMLAGFLEWMAGEYTAPLQDLEPAGRVGYARMYLKVNPIDLVKRS